jgi:hypothetical protein
VSYDRFLNNLDPVYPLEKMDIPKLQDVKSQLVAKEVDDLLTVDKELSHKM